jgi:FkbH-like protein
MTTYRISSYVRTLQVDDHSVWAGHPFFGNFVLKGEFARIFQAMLQHTASEEDLSVELSLPLGNIRKATHFFSNYHFALKEDEDESAHIQGHLRKLSSLQADVGGVSYIRKVYRDHSALDLNVTAERGGWPRTQATFLIVGGCLTQVAADAILRLAPAFNIVPKTEETHPALLESALMDSPDVIVLQQSTSSFLAPLWDHGDFVSDSERATRLAMMKEQVQLLIAKVRERAERALLLVHGFVTPLYSPLGRTEFRHQHHFYRIIYELNQAMMDAIRNDPNAMFVDEERLLSAVGKARLTDDAVSTFSHHGPIDLVVGHVPTGVSREETFGTVRPCHAPELFARAYLESFCIWKGIGRIKCIIVDLDNTLWPGLSSDADFNLDDGTTTFLFGTFAGIHQGLQLARHRGALLAVCSRNHEEDVQKGWTQLKELIASGNGSPHLLQPGDFVVHKVNWESKSKNIAAIMSALGLSPEAVLFIDDSAIEREEVQAAYPTMRVLGENMNLVRSVLLDDFGLQINIPTTENASRTEMVKAQLVRDADQKEARNEHDFLKRLEARLTVTRVRGSARLARIVELIQRTNQFNTTLLRLGAEDIHGYMSGPDSAVYVLDARDRFANYGLVGVCVLGRHEIASFVISCRIIPLRAELPFLIAALLDYGRVPLTARIVDGPRNQPCRHVYRDARFIETAPGSYLLPQLQNLPSIDESIYHVNVVAEAGAQMA